MAGRKCFGRLHTESVICSITTFEKIVLATANFVRLEHSAVVTARNTPNVTIPQCQPIETDNHIPTNLQHAGRRHRGLLLANDMRRGSDATHCQLFLFCFIFPVFWRFPLRLIEVNVLSYELMQGTDRIENIWDISFILLWSNLLFTEPNFLNVGSWFFTIPQRRTTDPRPPIQGGGREGGRWESGWRSGREPKVLAGQDWVVLLSTKIPRKRAFCSDILLKPCNGNTIPLHRDIPSSATFLCGYRIVLKEWNFSYTEDLMICYC